MARIPYADTDSQPEQVREYIARSGGLNILRMLAHAGPATFEGFNRLSRGLMIESRLDPQLREIAILRVGYLSRAAYEIYHHEAVGRGVGLTEKQIDAIRAGDAGAEVLTPVQRAVLAFADDVVLNVRASDATLQAVRAVLSDSDLVELILVIGCYMMIARLLETTGVDIDELPLSVSTLSDKSD